MIENLRLLMFHLYKSGTSDLCKSIVKDYTRMKNSSSSSFKVSSSLPLLQQSGDGGEEVLDLEFAGASINLSSSRSFSMQRVSF